MHVQCIHPNIQCVCPNSYSVDVWPISHSDYLAITEVR